MFNHKDINCIDCGKPLKLEEIEQCDTCFNNLHDEVSEILKEWD